jgi:hypothetical protein
MKIYTARKRSFSLIGFLFLGYLGACTMQSRELVPESGMDYFAVDPSLVSEIRYSAAEDRLYAYRRSNENEFNVFTAQGLATRTCISIERFSALLATLTRVKVIKENQGDLAAKNGKRVQIQMWNEKGEELIEMSLLIPNAKDDKTKLLFRGREFSTEMDTTALQDIVSVCPASSL